MEQPPAQSADPQTDKYPSEEDDVKLEEQINDLIKKVPLEIRVQLAALNHYVLSKKQSDVFVGKRMQEVGDKYYELQKPSLVEINKIVSGERAPTEQEIEGFKTHLTADETSKIAESLTATPFTDYWFKVLTSCVRFEGLIFDVDHPLLKKITKIESIPEPGESIDFTIVLHFAENEYFENASLSLKVIMADEDVPEKIEASEIKWREGKDITKKTIKKRKKNKKTGKHVNVEKIVDAESFFTLFKNIDLSKATEDEDKEEEEGGDQEILQQLQGAYEFAATVQEEILLYHVEYYVGIRKGDEEDDGMGGLGGYPGMEDDDDEDIPPRTGGMKLGKK